MAYEDEITFWIEEVAVGVATESEFPIQIYPGDMLGTSFDLPAPSIISSPSVAFTLPTIPMFCIRDDPVGLVPV